jgi:hypothetical protein
MPILPLIDLMILIAWTCLIVAVVQKVLSMALALRTAIFGMTPYDFVLVAGVSLLFALALAARAWVKANQARLLGSRQVPEPLNEVLPDFPDPRIMEMEPDEDRPEGGGTHGRMATGYPR